MNRIEALTWQVHYALVQGGSLELTPTRVRFIDGDGRRRALNKFRFIGFDLASGRLSYFKLTPTSGFAIKSLSHNSEKGYVDVLSSAGTLHIVNSHYFTHYTD